MPKKDVLQLPTWEGDAVFLKLLLDNEEKFFTLKLIYEDEKLVEKNIQFYQKVRELQMFRHTRVNRVIKNPVMKN